ncbi:MAG: peptidase M50 [Magnetococcales bacterium]|nr:peptidase M50 [Magnetococcales bacterium]
MSETFSESWHRVASVRTALRPTITVRKRQFRGRPWVVLHDPYNNAWFRVRPEAYAFLARLRLAVTVDEVWQSCLKSDPDNAPGQPEAMRILTQLAQSNLLTFDAASDSGRLAEQSRKRKQQTRRAKWMSFLFIRIPLGDPDRWLQRYRALYGLVFGRVGLVIWLAVVGLGLDTAVRHWHALNDQSANLLAPDNLLLLYLGMAIVKSVHEWGHAAACTHYGGNVHGWGVMLLLFTPLPYVDATASWQFRAKRQRAFVDLAGMYCELFIGALALLLWVVSPPGLVRSLAYNMVFIATVSTVLFNANPLLKFDGYYLLSDLLDVPNLQTRARSRIRYWLERLLFAVNDTTAPPGTRREEAGFLFYGVAAAFYKVFITVGIILFVSEQYLVLGWIMAAFLLVQWLVVPPVKLVKHITTSPRLVRKRRWAATVTIALLTGLVMVVAMVPMPMRVTAPGIVEAEVFRRVVNAAPGSMREVVVASGERVEAGQPLVRLINPELEAEIADARAQWDQVLAQERMIRSTRTAEMATIRRRKQAIRELLDHQRRRLRDLTVTAPATGIWVAPQVHRMTESWFQRGSALGMVISLDRFRFKAVIAQEDAGYLFHEHVQGLEVRLHGRAEQVIPVTSHRLTPYQKETLPSPALGWLGGGEIAVSQEGQGDTALEPFFLLTADLAIDPDHLQPLHGRTGRIRLTFEDRPLGVQGWQALRQFLQQRYLL